MVDVLLGLQWGDEGKGKIVDFLAPKYDIVARFQGGPNAGHTLVIDGQKIVLHTVPSGILQPATQNLVGNGVVLDPVVFNKEIANLNASGVNTSNLYLSKKAHLILPTHKVLDAASEHAKGAGKIGSTLKGIGPTYMDKTGRNGLRIGDILLPDFKDKYETLKQKHLAIVAMYDFQFDIAEQELAWFQAVEQLKSYKIVDGEYFINDAIKSGKKILAEGAQGSMLDIDFGTYPFVTSSNTITASACTGLGIAPHHIGEVLGITKAYCTRVGSGPFPTELLDETGDLLRKYGNEFGSTTGRPRRCGWLDLAALNYTIMLNGVTQLIITKPDVMNSFDEVKIATGYKYDNKNTEQLPYDLCSETVEPVYETVSGWKANIGDCKSYDELPAAVKNFLQLIETKTTVPVKYLSTGPERTELIVF